MSILKRWTENGALRATNARYRKIDALLVEIASLWGDVDQGNVDRVDDLREAIESARLEAVIACQERAERDQEQPPKHHDEDPNG